MLLCSMEVKMSKNKKNKQQSQTASDKVNGKKESC
jgi:hypothetical protein